jgi:hypothetical protein
MFRIAPAATARTCHGPPAAARRDYGRHMTRFGRLATVTVLFGLVVGACTSREGAEAAPTTTSAATTTTTTTTTFEAPPEPTLADLPAEGRNLQSCSDGQCRVTVQPGDHIPVPPAAGGVSITIEAISPAEVSITMDPGNGGMTSFTFFANPTGATGLGNDDKFTVGFLDLADGQATMQLDV